METCFLLQLAFFCRRTFLHYSHLKANRKKLLGQNKGQIIVEYILLMVIVVSACAMLTRTLVGRGDEPGAIIIKWNQLNQMVGADIEE